MNAKTYERLQDISYQFKRQHFIAMPGSTYENPRDVQVGHTYQVVDHLMVIHAGWRRGAPGINKSCGIAIMIQKPYFVKDDVKLIDPGPADLRGRVLAVRITKGNFLDVTLFCLYFPPKPSRAADQKRWLDTCLRIIQWFDQALSECRGRSTPVLMTDLNDFFTQNHINNDDLTVGPFITSRQRRQGPADLLARTLRKHDMAVLTTHKSTPPTYIGITGNGSHIDHIGVPTALVSECSDTVRVLTNQAKAVQATPYCIDHRPVGFLLPVTLPILKKPKAELQWDSKLIAEAMKTGKDRAACLLDIQTSLLEHEAAFETYRADPTPERQNKLLIEIITANGLKYYSLKSEIDEQQEKDRKENRRLLGVRRAIMQDFPSDTPSHSPHQ